MKDELRHYIENMHFDYYHDERNRIRKYSPYLDSEIAHQRAVELADYLLYMQAKQALNTQKSLKDTVELEQ